MIQSVDGPLYRDNSVAGTEQFYVFDMKST